MVISFLTEKKGSRWIGWPLARCFHTNTLEEHSTHPHSRGLYLSQPISPSAKPPFYGPLLGLRDYFLILSNVTEKGPIDSSMTQNWKLDDWSSHTTALEGLKAVHSIRFVRCTKGTHWRFGHNRSQLLEQDESTWVFDLFLWRRKKKRKWLLWEQQCLEKFWRLQK